MTVAKGKKRKYITLEIEVWEYLEERVKAETKLKQKKGQITTSTILAELAENDKKIREAFRLPTTKRK